MSAASADIPHSRDDFEVAIVCALKCEADAVIALFDKTWDDRTHDLRPSLSEDKHEYTFGRIWRHNVVVVRLPNMGKREASSAVAAMHPTFRNMQLCLVVGVCGVAPCTKDGSEILLGDVVISTYVIESDRGRQYDDIFTRTDNWEGNLSRPAQQIQGILGRLELDYHQEQLIERMRGYLSKLQSQKKIYAYPGREFDHLYPTDYTHMHRAPDTCSECREVDGAPGHTCATAKVTSCADLGCETSHLIPRERRSEPTVSEGQASVWFGRFASGDQVIKSATHRQRLHDKEKVIGFEMEGSGAWEHFPTVIIKSGCDYADSHKNKTWQNYCAGTAAACTKAFLDEWRRKESVRQATGVPFAPDQAQSVASTTPRPCVPPPRASNLRFLGRAAELAEIEQQLVPTIDNEHGQSGQPKILVIHGLGGTGKSELCLRYLNLHQQSYWAIFWIDGSTSASLISGFQRIATQLGLASDDVASVRYSLTALEQSWLLIIDNADDPNLDLAPYLPDQGTGHVLITTRDPYLDIFGTVPTLGLEGLAEDDALALFFKSADIPVKDQASFTMGAEEIVEKLHHHTLAIIQAGAYIRKTHDLKDYLRMFDAQRKRVLEYYDPQAKAEYGSVYQTFEVSASRLRQEADEQQKGSAAADALELLQLFAFMDTQGPFERIFCDARDFATEYAVSEESTSNATDIIHIEDVEDLTRKHSHLLTPLAYATNDLDGKVRWREACDKLRQYSMLSFGGDDNGDEVLIFHPLVLAWAQARQSDYDCRRSWLSVAFLIFLSCRGSSEFGPLLVRIVTHARTCADYVLKDWWTDTSSIPFLFLPYNLGWVIFQDREDAVIAKLCQCLEAALETTEMEQLISSSELQHIRYLVGRQAHRVGNVGESIQLLEHVVQEEERTVPEAHPNLVASQIELATAYESNGQIGKAIQLLEHVVQVQQTLVETHRSRLLSQHELAAAYKSNGQVEEAVELLEHVVRIQGKTLAETHPGRLASQHELAAAYKSNGQVEEAVELLEHVVRIEGKILVETHPDRLASQDMLASAYLLNKQVNEAVRLLEHVVQAQQQRLAETHPNRLSSQHLLASAYLSNGQDKEAIQLLEHVVKVREQILAETHPNRLRSQHLLASAYSSNGQVKEAIQLSEHVVKVREQTLAETHSRRLDSQHLLASAYLSNGQVKEAVQLSEHVVKVREQTLAETDPHRLTSQHLLAAAYGLNGQGVKAVELLEQVVKIQEQTLAKTDPHRLAAEEMLLDIKHVYLQELRSKKGGEASRD